MDNTRDELLDLIRNATNIDMICFFAIIWINHLAMWLTFFLYLSLGAIVRVDILLYFLYY